jgi:Peptidase family S41
MRKEQPIRAPTHRLHWYHYLMACASLSTTLAVHAAEPTPMTSRAHREHAASVPAQLAQQFHPTRLPFAVDQPLTSQEVADDLDELEWILENRYSYLRLREIDYKAALDAVRLSARQGSHRSTLAVQIAKLLSRFGDGHSVVSDPALTRLCSGYLPFLPEWADGQLLAVKANYSAFLSDECPVLETLDDLPVRQWFEAAEKITPAGSPQLQRTRATRNLRLVPYLRMELGLPPTKAIRVGLCSLDGRRRAAVELPLAADMPIYGEGIIRDTQLLPGNIGYLRIKAMDDKPAFLDSLMHAMANFRNTQGLIIDIRNNGGGSRAPLRVLFPFFTAPGEAPAVRNVAALRLGHSQEGLAGRWLYPAESPQWSPAERKAIEHFADDFKPEWILPAGQFGSWHYLVLSGQAGQPNYYHYDRPVIVLMNSANFSAADIFLGALKGRPGITLMGTPSGGGSGMQQKYRLTRSGIQMRLCAMASFQPDGTLYDTNGIQPDVLIEPQARDLIGQGDSTLDAALTRLTQISRTHVDHPRHPESVDEHAKTR